MKTINISSFNACNFGEWTSNIKRQQFVELIANTLKKPEIVALQEIGGIVSDISQPVPAKIMHEICEKLLTQYSLKYEYFEIAPHHNQNGGEVDLNIRCGFLILSESESSNCNKQQEQQEQHKISVTNIFLLDNEIDCFKGNKNLNFEPSRAPLVIEINIENKQILIINCHLKSMRSKNMNVCKKQRHVQALAIANFASLVTDSTNIPIIILGDMNDVPGSKTIEIFKQQKMHSFLDLIDIKQEYTHVYKTKTMILDHIFFNNNLCLQSSKIHMIHTKCSSKKKLLDKQSVLSDHNPISAIFTI